MVGLDKNHFGEFLRFCIVGLIATAIHYGLYVALISVIQVDHDLWLNVAYTIAYIVSWACNLFLTAHFTFNERVTFKRGIGFAISHGVNYLLHILFLNIFLWLGLSKQLAPLPVFCIVVPINFILVRTVFKRL